MTKPKSKATPRKIGRPTKFTPEVRERILIAIRAGNYIDTAAQSAGINKDTFYSWMAKAETSGAPKEYYDFADDIKKARAEAEIQAVGVIQQAANRGTWQAAAWYLERSYPDRFGRTRIETSGVAEEPIQENAAVIDLLDARIALMKERSKRIIEGYRVPVAAQAEGEPPVVEIPASSAIAERIAEILASVPIPAPIVEEIVPVTPVLPRRRMPAPIIRPGRSLRNRR